MPNVTAAGFSGSVCVDLVAVRIGLCCFVSLAYATQRADSGVPNLFKLLRVCVAVATVCVAVVTICVAAWAIPAGCCGALAGNPAASGECTEYCVAAVAFSVGAAAVGLGIGPGVETGVLDDVDLSLCFSAGLCWLVV